MRVKKKAERSVLTVSPRDVHTVDSNLPMVWGILCAEAEWAFVRFLF